MKAALVTLERQADLPRLRLADALRTAGWSSSHTGFVEASRAVSCAAVSTSHDIEVTSKKRGQGFQCLLEQIYGDAALTAAPRPILWLVPSSMLPRFTAGTLCDITMHLKSR